MTVPPVPLLDWRRQMELLEPFLCGRGGVVHVHVSDGSPASNVLKALRQLMENGNRERPWKCVQLDPRNPNTHYLEDVVAQLERSLELDLDSGPLDNGRIQVGTQIDAEKVEIRDVNIGQEDEYARTRRSLARLDQVAEGIRDRLESEWIGLLLLNSHTYEKDTLARFRNLLWDKHLASMTGMGLLLIDFSDPSRRYGDVWPPNPNLLLDLPERFDYVSRPFAHEDLAKLALDERLVTHSREADGFAKALLASNNATIRDVYTGLANSRANLNGDS